MGLSRQYSIDRTLGLVFGLVLLGGGGDAKSLMSLILPDCCAEFISSEVNLIKLYFLWKLFLSSRFQVSIEISQLFTLVTSQENRNHSRFSNRGHLIQGIGFISDGKAEWLNWRQWGTPQKAIAGSRYPKGTEETGNVTRSQKPGLWSENKNPAEEAWGKQRPWKGGTV